MKFSFKPIGGATWIMQFDDLKIACDPVLSAKGSVKDFFWFKSKRTEEPVYEDSDFRDIDLWLLTHNHKDHLDNEGLKIIDKNTKLIIHKNLKKRLNAYNILILKHHQSSEFKIHNFIIKIEAIPAVHGVNPLSAFFAGGVNGYWISIIKENKKIEIYVSGDTVDKYKVIKSIQNRKSDIFIPNVGAASKGSVFGTLTMTARMLNKFIQIHDPEIILPVHYGAFSHYNEPIEEIEKINNDRIKIIKAGDILTKEF